MTLLFKMPSADEEIWHAWTAEVSIFLPNKIIHVA